MASIDGVDTPSGNLPLYFLLSYYCFIILANKFSLSLSLSLYLSLAVLVLVLVLRLLLRLLLHHVWHFFLRSSMILWRDINVVCRRGEGTGICAGTVQDLGKRNVA